MADKDKPITIGGKTYKNRAEFNKFVRGIGLPTKEDAEKEKEYSLLRLVVIRLM